MHSVNVEEFKARCSSIEKIMGKIGLTEKQESKLKELQLRHDGEGKPLTQKMVVERLDLVTKRDNPELPQGCKTYLMEWYSDRAYGKSSDVQTKYTIKGHLCEDEAIEVVELMLGDFGERMEKNTERKSNEWIEGECDVDSNGIIYDTKCPWDGKTFLDSVVEPHNTLYIWQMRGYMWLWERPIAKVCYVLLDTPEDANYGEEVIFSDTPIEDRFYHFAVLRQQPIEEEIKERVILCRKWLAEYDKKINSLLSK